MNKDIYALMNYINQDSYEIDVLDPDYDDDSHEDWDDEIYND